MVLHHEDKNTIMTKTGTGDRISDTCASVNAGICGFTCRIKAWKIDKRTVGLEISESECQQILNYSELIRQLTLNEVFMPAIRNPLYLAAEQAGCHPSCPIPAAVLKTAEVAMQMALPRDASIRFVPCKREMI